MKPGRESGNYRSACSGIHRCRLFRRFLPEPEMRPVVVVVADVIREQPFQIVLVQGNDVIEELAAAAFEPSLGNSVLPRTFARGSYSPDLRERTAAGTSIPYLPSRSKRRNREADSNGNVSRNCRTTHRLVGWLVTLKCNICRRSCLITKKQ